MQTLTRTIASVILLSCLSTTAFSAEKLRFVGDVDFATGEKFMETEIGGLSGITFDAETGKLHAVSDDKGFVNDTRYYTFDVSLTENKFSLKPSAVTIFRTQEGQVIKKGIADYEGIALLGKDLLVSSEGSVFGSHNQPPELLLFSAQGKLLSNLPIPPKFISPAKDSMMGTRANKAFETLAVSPDQKNIFMATEEAIFQDGSITTSSLSSAVRIIHYQNLKPTKEYAYQLQKLDEDKSVVVEIAETGLVDIAMIDDKNFYSMERSYLPLKKKNVIRIFKNSITAKTTDVSKIQSLKTAEYSPVEKTLILDLDDVVPSLQSTAKALDNIEGLSFGPTLKNGNRTLIVCSDNNFSKTQRTMFIAFEILKN